jgi:hypothetical protein
MIAVDARVREGTSGFVGGIVRARRFGGFLGAGVGCLRDGTSAPAAFARVERAQTTDPVQIVVAFGLGREDSPQEELELSLLGSRQRFNKLSRGAESRTFDAGERPAATSSQVQANGAAAASRPPHESVVLQSVDEADRTRVCKT